MESFLPGERSIQIYFVDTFNKVPLFYGLTIINNYKYKVRGTI